MTKNILDFKGLKISIASPETIRDWSFGEVTKPETINYRTLKPEKDGLFCERIFGPTKDYECYCGKYKRIRYRGIVCDKCGVEVTQSRVRRERMGHINLSAPTAHIWYFKGAPSKLSLLTNIPPKSLSAVIYFSKYLVLSIDKSAKAEVIESLAKSKAESLQGLEDKAKEEMEKLKVNLESKLEGIAEEKLEKSEQAMALESAKLEVKRQIETIREHLILDKDSTEEIYKTVTQMAKRATAGAVMSEEEYLKLEEYSATSHLRVGMGAEAVLEYVNTIDIQKLSKQLKEDMKSEASGLRKSKLAKRLKVVDGLKNAGLNASWMIMKVIPVFPPGRRPMVQLSGGRFASSDLNDLYRRVINRNNRLRHLIDLGAPEIILRNEKRMLQEAVDSLIDSSQARSTRRSRTGKTLKSLSDMLRGKQGRFRQNLLGKRVDYSGRSVIVVGPELKLNQCGLPKRMALELFKPFVIHNILEQGLAHNVRGAGRLIEDGPPEVWAALEDVIKDRKVLLNRAPTLHRLGVQAFYPRLIEGMAIELHPLVCRAFNADFDGDQMAVHLPLSQEAQDEAETKMLSSHNLLKPATGEPVVNPTKDMVLGIYWITKINPTGKGAGKLFSSKNEAVLAYNFDKIDINSPVKILIKPEKRKGNEKFLETSVGRIFFNTAFPNDLDFINKEMKSKNLEELISEVIERYGMEEAAKILDKIKLIGFSYATTSGISWGMDDLSIPEAKGKIMQDAEKEVEKIEDQYQSGLLTNEESYKKVIEVWTNAKSKVANEVKKTLPPGGSVFSIIDSGSRGSWAQPIQMSGMKGLVINPAGRIIELPVKSSFKEGFDVLEYFISTHGARKGTADTALRTSTAGYLTRRLVDVSQDIVIREEDCKDSVGIIINKKDTEEMGKSFASRLFSRTLIQDIKDKNGKILIRAGEIVDKDKAEIIESLGLEKVNIRSVITCKSVVGICRKCYGYDLGNNKLIELGEAAGIVAAQSIGEPGTQLTMRTFHTGGVAAGGDITQGLPRVQEIFEARPVKKPALISPVDGVVMIEEDKDKKQKIIKIKGYEIHRFETNIAKEDFDRLEIKKSGKIKKDAVILANDGKEIKAPFAGELTLDKKDKENWKVRIENKKEVEKELPPVSGLALWVKDKDQVARGQQLTEGALDPHELFSLRGQLETQRYVLKEIQHIYSSQGQKLNDKHIEIIAKQMFSRVFIENPGDSYFSPGEIVEISEFNDANENLKEHKKELAKGNIILLGI